MASSALSLPGELDPARLRRHGLQVVGLLTVLVLVAVLTPGLGDVRDHLADAAPGWVIAAVVLQGLSCACYVLMFRPVFCRKMTTRTSVEIGLSEVAMGSIVPASGAGGVALGAWVLHRDGMSSERIARRSVAFLLIKSSVNFLAVAILGVVMFAGLTTSDVSPALTILPAALAAAVLVGVTFVPRMGEGTDPGEDAHRVRRAVYRARAALIDGVHDAGEVLRRHEPALIVGALGYWAFDNAVLWAAFEAFGSPPGLDIILMGYLIGQLGGALPLPGGVGGIDGGLLGTLVVYGASASAAAAAVLVYRLILFWLPLLLGAPAFASLRRNLNSPERPDLCADAATPEPATG